MNSLPTSTPYLLNDQQNAIAIATALPSPQLSSQLVFPPSKPNTYRKMLVLQIMAALELEL